MKIDIPNGNIELGMERLTIGLHKRMESENQITRMASKSPCHGMGVCCILMRK